MRAKQVGGMSGTISFEKRFVRRAVSWLAACAFVGAATFSGVGPAHAQGAPPQPVADEEPPPADSPIPPNYTQTDDPGQPPGQRPPPPGYGPPPPGYGPPPPGYGPPPDPYNYGVPPGTPQAGYIDDWEEGDPIPPGYRPDTRIRKGLVIGGAVTMGSLWLISVVIGGAGASVEEADDALGDSDGIHPEDFYMLMIPVAGPFIAMGTLEASGAGLAFLIIDGIGQAGGLAMLIAGIAAQETYLRPAPQYGEIDVKFAPVLAPGFAGMGVTGTF